MAIKWVLALTFAFLLTYGVQCNEISSAKNGKELCGGRINQEDTLTGSITSPNYPNNYPNNAICSWTFIAKEGYVPMIEFSSFSTPPNNINTYVKFYDGANQHFTNFATVKGQFDVNARAFVGRDIYLTMTFSSDSGLTAKGFSADFSFVKCGGYFEQEQVRTEQFSSIRYPMNKYPNYELCTWNIDASPGYQVLLTISDLATINDNSYRDILYISDGPTMDFTHIATLSGQLDQHFSTFISTSESLTVMFVADYNKTDRGFNASFEFVQCGQVFKQSDAINGTFTSIGFPSKNYPNNCACTWNFIPSKGYRAVITLTIMSTEPNYDFIHFYDGPTNGFYNLARLSGDLDDNANKFVSHEKEFTVVFTSNLGTTSRGFSAIYQFEKCGDRYSEAQSPQGGTISSIHYPNFYPNYEYCEWNIQASIGNVVWITLNDLQTEFNRDFLNLYDGPTTGSPKIASLSGDLTQSQSAFVGGENSLTVTFSSTVTNNDKGFLLTYQYVECGFLCSQSDNCPTSGIISSIGFPNPYPNNEFCEWNFLANDGFYVAINITSLDTTSTDYVNFYDGPSSAYNKFQSLSGQFNSAKSVYLSGKNHFMTVAFLSDLANTAGGFQAHYEFVTCGSNHTQAEYPDGGVISSPYYPQHYPNNAYCYWYLKGNTGNVIATIEEFETVGLNDKLSIFDGPSEASANIANIYGTIDAGRSYKATQGSMTLRFSTDLETTGTGFQIRFAWV